METSVKSLAASLWCWFKSKAWLLGLLLLTALNVAAYVRTSLLVKRVMSESAATRADVNEVKVALAGLAETPLAYREAPGGLHLTHADKGNSKAELEFLQAFRGRFLPKEVDVGRLKPGELIAKLHDSILKGYADNRAHLQPYGLSERQALIAYTALRTNGSMPTYEVREQVPNDLEQLVAGPSGNCSDYALRLMFALESIGVQAASFSIVTDSIPGHVVVDAYDPVEDMAYLLDANFNIMLMHPHSQHQGFIESFRKNKKNAHQFAHDTKLIAFPAVVRFVDPGETAYTSTPLTPAFINQQRQKREPMWRTWMEQDGDDLVAFWQRAPAHAPHTLKEWRESGALSVIPPEFNVSGDFARKIRAATKPDGVQPK